MAERKGHRELTQRNPNHVGNSAMSATIVPSNASLKASSPGDWSVRRVFGETSFRSDAEVQAVAFGPGGLWSVEEGSCLRQWDSATGRLLSWRNLEDVATLWSFRSDGRLLAGAASDLILWDVPSGQRRAILPQSSWVTAVAFLPGSELIATGHDDGVVRVWDMDDGQLLREFRGYFRSVSALAFSPDGKRIISAGEDKLILVWNFDTGEINGLIGGHTDRIPALIWHPDGRRIISAGWDTTARIWDANTHEPIILLNNNVGQVVALALSPNGNILACADAANDVHIWDMNSNEEMHLLREAEAEVRCLAFNADGTRLVAGGADRSLHLWQPISGECLSGESGELGPASSVAVSPDGRRLVDAHGTMLRVWNLDSGELMEQRRDCGLRAAALSPDGQLMAIAGDRVELLEAATGKSKRLLDGLKPPIVTLAFAASAPLLAAGGGSSADVWVWDTCTGEPALLIPEAVSGCVVQCLAFQPHRSVLAVGGCDWYEATGSDGMVVVWDVAGKRREALLGGGAASLAFDPTGRRLAVAGLDHTLRFWHLTERRLLGEWIGHTDSVRGLAFSPDGRWLASASDDRTVRLWHVDSGRPAWIASLSVQATSIAIGPSGKELYTGNADGSCSQFDIPAILEA
jgi:WD40 repeat protein